MKSVWSFLIALVVSAGVTLGSIDTAEAAKRFGGGKSFGSKFSQSQSVKRQNNAGASQKATAAQQTNLERKQQLGKKGGLMGMLGALAIGGLLGAMFFGGAFDGVNFMDILLFGLIAFLLFKFLSSRAKRSAPTPATATAGGYGNGMEDDSYQQRQTATDTITGSGNENNEEGTLDSLRGGVTRKFDTDNFLDGAKSCFARMQRAWDDGDLADIREFTTDHVFGEIQDQVHAKEGQSKTEIVELNAELLKTEDLGSRQEAIVLFRAKLSEDGNPLSVEEVWHFVRPSTSTQPTWLLDGIQQVES
ncbi:Tim44 domain-containing protein [Pseudomonadota bacterium]